MSEARTGAVLVDERLLLDVGVRNAAEWTVVLRRFMPFYGIKTKRPVAMFLANALHETGRFSRLVENLNYSSAALIARFGPRRGMDEDTANRLGRRVGQPPLSLDRQRQIADIIYGGQWGARNLGNTEPGDGARFIGRGLMQLTGRYNMTRFARRLGRPLDDALLAWLETPEGAVESACHFWRASDLNGPAERGDVATVRRIINGGDFGLEEVQAAYADLMADLERRGY